MDAAAKMVLFQNLFYASAAIAGVGFILALFLFFYFDIRNVYALMTGKAKRQTIERMSEQNAKTGRMRAVSENIRDPNIPRIQQPSTAIIAEVAPTTPISRQPDYMETNVLTDRGETTILNEQNETTVLNRDARQVGYSPDGAGETAILASSPASYSNFRFDITESTIVLHTDELL